jgi:hypothetical protein
VAVGLERVRGWFNVPAEAPRADGPRASEIAVAAGLLLLLMTAALWLSGSFSLFGRFFWYDESLTQTIVADPDFLHSMRALAGGVETHPPTYYVLLRGVTTVLGRADEVPLRWFAYLCTVVGLVGLYATLRFAYPPLAAFAATLAVGAHPLVLHQGFEARHYNVLLAEAAWLCYFLLRSRVPGAGLWTVIGLAVMAILMVTTHYFGIICLALILAGDALVSFRSGRARLCRVVALAAGVVALACCLPLLRSQRAAITVPTWLPPPKLGDIREIFRLLFVPLLVLIVLVCAVGLLTLARSRRRAAAPQPPAATDWRSMAGLLSLAAMPFVLLVMTYVYQPVLLDRYALPAVLALAPPIAWACVRFPRWLAVIVCAGFWLSCGVEMRYLADDYRTKDAQRAQFMTMLRQDCQPDAPIAFHTPIRLSWVMRYAPDLAPRCYQLDFEWEDLDRGAESHFFTRDLGRQEAAYYGRPRMLSCHDLKLPVAYVVFDQPDMLPKFRPFAGLTQRHLGLGLFELTFPGQAP